MEFLRVLFRSPKRNNLSRATYGRASKQRARSAGLHRRDTAKMSLADTADLQSLSSRLRAKRDVRLRALISAVHDRKGAVRIIDMGGTPEYWERVGLDFLRASNAHVTITNLHETSLARGRRNVDLFDFAVGNACDLPQVPDRKIGRASCRERVCQYV